MFKLLLLVLCETIDAISAFLLSLVFGGVLLGVKKKKGNVESQQHLLFPGGHPSKYWAGPTLLNFGDQTRTGVLNVVWP